MGNRGDRRLRHLAPFRRGKVRDLYRLDGGRLLMVASDRISAFDVALPTPIPDKGRLLTALSLFWFERLAPILPNHVLGCELDGLALTDGERAWLQGRAMVVREARMLPVELVVRGYLAGSAWRDYRASGAVCGIALPLGMAQGERLARPIFTPATKADDGGHDEAIDFARMAALVGGGLARQARAAALALYEAAAAHAEGCGLILADTKFEMGVVDGALVLADECLTGDSSRYWPAADWRPGHIGAGFDKQFVRDWLDSLPGWDRRPPGPALPGRIVRRTRARYVEAFERLTGRAFEGGRGRRGGVSPPSPA